MGLRDLTFPTVVVQTSGGPLPVRGLGCDHILGLFYRHRDELTALFDGVVGTVRTNGGLTPDDVVPIALQMIDIAPTVVAEIIALASGSDPRDKEGFAGDVGISRMLSIAEQMDALEKIAGQTFTSDMPPGKMLALLQKTVRAGSSAAIQQGQG